MIGHPVGISSVRVGDTRITHLPDGYHRADPLASFPGSTSDDWDAHAHLLDGHGRVVMTMGALLVELADGSRVLVDLGFGPRSLVLASRRMDFWGGRLLRSLAAVGLVPEQIDAVVYSHLHIDHVGWTSQGPDRSLTFPNARHLMSRAEWDFWRHRGTPDTPSAEDFAAWEPRIELIDGEAEPLPGLHVVPTPGHTPGHCSFLVTSGGHRAVVLGDAIHCPLQITHPEWAFAADANPDAARRAREQLLRELDAPDTVVVGAHFPDAVFGRVLAGSTPRRVAFDVAPAAPTQMVHPDAAPEVVFAPPLPD